MWRTAFKKLLIPLLNTLSHLKSSLRTINQLDVGDLPIRALVCRFLQLLLGCLLFLFPQIGLILLYCLFFIGFKSTRHHWNVWGKFCTCIFYQVTAWLQIDFDIKKTEKGHKAKLANQNTPAVSGTQLLEFL